MSIIRRGLQEIHKFLTLLPIFLPLLWILFFLNIIFASVIWKSILFLFKGVGARESLMYFEAWFFLKWPQFCNDTYLPLSFLNIIFTPLIYISMIIAPWFYLQEPKVRYRKKVSLIASFIFFGLMPLCFPVACEVSTNEMREFKDCRRKLKIISDELDNYYIKFKNYPNSLPLENNNDPAFYFLGKFNDHNFMKCSYVYTVNDKNEKGVSQISIEDTCGNHPGDTRHYLSKPGHRIFSYQAQRPHLSSGE